jgi:hypothetical protein
MNIFCGVMLTLSLADLGFDPLLGETKTIKLVFVTSPLGKQNLGVGTKIFI